MFTKHIQISTLGAAYISRIQKRKKKKKNTMIKEQCPPPSTHSRPQRVGPPAEQIEIADHRDRVRQAPAVEHEPVAETDGGVVGAVEQVDEEGQEGQGYRAGENLWRVWCEMPRERKSAEWVAR